MGAAPVIRENFPPPSEYCGWELQQSRDEGRDTAVWERLYGELRALPAGDPARETMALRILDELPLEPVVSSSRREPSDLDGIRRESPEGTQASRRTATVARDLSDSIHGAWIGRCAGCLLGQPVESWRRDRLLGLLRDTGNLPLRRYIRSDVGPEIRDRYKISDTGWMYGSSRLNWVNNIDHMPEDDEINFPTVALKVWEQRGESFTPEDVAGVWLDNLPALHVFSAERIAYANFIQGVAPPESAGRRNPCREWIGGQIRGDFWGWINPGNPSAAAEMAWRDACLSHRKNGIYGAMFVAAGLAEAAVTDDLDRILDAGLGQIPAGSRYAEAIRGVRAWRREGMDKEAAIGRLHAEWDETDEHHWCHAVPNGMVVTIGLLWGGLELSASIGTAVEASFDKDSNGATVGSIVGMMRGARAIPDSWTAPLRDTVSTSLKGYHVARISELARRTATIAASRRDRV